MPIRIKCSDLKTATKLTSRVKDVEEPDDKVLYWSTVHRLIATPEKLRLLTTDKEAFLDWSIPLSDTGQDEFDLLVPAVQLNTVASHGLDGAFFEIHKDADLLTLTQGKGVTLVRNSQIQGSGPRRTLRIKTEEVSTDYPPTPSHEGTKWTTRAQPLAQALAFVAGYVWDDDKVSESKRVASWLPGGDLIAGNDKMFCFVSGLDSPPDSLNLKKVNAEIVSAFLKNLGEQVEIDLAVPNATFRCPEAGHTLVIPVEDVSFPVTFKDIGNDRDHEVFRTDTKTLLDALETLGALVPSGESRLDLRLSGDSLKSIIHLSTPTEPRLQSSDVLPAGCRRQVRHVEDETQASSEVLTDGDPSAETLVHYEDTVFPVYWESLRYALKSLDSVGVDLKYLPDPGRKGHHYIRVYAVKKDAQDPERSVLVQAGKGTIGSPRPAREQEPPIDQGTAEELEQPTTPPGVAGPKPGDGQPADGIETTSDLLVADNSPNPALNDQHPSQDEPPAPATPQSKPGLVRTISNGTGGRSRGNHQR